MAKEAIKIKNQDIDFIIKAKAYNLANKHFNNVQDREVFMAGVEYAIKQYKRLKK